MKGLILSFLCALVALLWWSSRVRAEHVIVASMGPKGDYCAFPDVCRLDDGRLLCVFYNGFSHVTVEETRGAVCGVLSEDDGKTWGRPFVLVDSYMDDRDPHVAQLADGRICLTYFRHQADGVYVTFIDSNWHACASRKLLHDAGTGGPMRQFRKVWITGAYHCEQPYIIRSRDNGRTWQVYAIPRDGKHLDAETDVIQLKDGKLFAALRGSGCNMQYSISPDLGETWTMARDIGFVGNCPYLHRAQDGTILLGVRAYEGKRSFTGLYWSTDETKTWQGPLEVDAKGGAYPSMCDLSDGSVLFVYYEEGGASNIRAKRILMQEGKPCLIAVAK